MVIVPAVVAVVAPRLAAVVPIIATLFANLVALVHALAPFEPGRAAVRVVMPMPLGDAEHRARHAPHVDHRERAPVVARAIPEAGFVDVPPVVVAEANSSRYICRYFRLTP